MKCVNGLQLKTADLRHRHCLVRGVRSHGGIWNSDIADHFHIPVIVCHDLAAERRGRRLAVGPGDRHDPSLRKMVGKLDLAPDRNPVFFQILNHRKIRRHSRT